MNKKVTKYATYCSFSPNTDNIFTKKITKDLPSQYEGVSVCETCATRAWTKKLQ